MKNSSKKQQREEGVKDFTKEYNEIMNTSENTVVVETQWEKEGDFFQKLSLYDSSFVMIESLGSTTLIKAQ